jgi:predicted anti-sigma-YlaC factor YlaD
MAGISTEELCCREVVELLGDYLEGAAAAADRARVEWHLAGCAGCLAYLAQLRTTIRLARRLAGETVRAETASRLLDAFRASRQA